MSTDPKPDSTSRVIYAIINTCKMLSSTHMISLAAFTAGFAWGIPSPSTKLLELPLSSLFNITLSIFFAQMGAHFVAELMPNLGKICLVATLFASSVFYTNKALL